MDDSFEKSASLYLCYFGTVVGFTYMDSKTPSQNQSTTIILLWYLSLRLGPQEKGPRMQLPVWASSALRQWILQEKLEVYGLEFMVQSVMGFKQCRSDYIASQLPKAMKISCLLSFLVCFSQGLLFMLVFTQFLSLSLLLSRLVLCTFFLWRLTRFASPSPVKVLPFIYSLFHQNKK